MSDNLSGPQQSDSLKYNGKYDSSKSFTPDLKLDSKAVKTEIVDLSPCNAITTIVIKIVKNNVMEKLKNF